MCWTFTSIKKKPHLSLSSSLPNKLLLLFVPVTSVPSRVKKSKLVSLWVYGCDEKILRDILHISAHIQKHIKTRTSRTV